MLIAPHLLFLKHQSKSSDQVVEVHVFVSCLGAFQTMVQIEITQMRVMVFGRAFQGLSAECLKQLCALCGVDLAGNCTCKLRVSKLLDHFCYSDELKAEILERFKKGDDNQAEVDENLAPELDSRCEAELLTKLLEEKQTSQSDEKEEKKPVTKKQKTGHGEANGNQGQGEEGKESVAPLVPFPVMDEKPDLAEAHVPSGCSLNVYQGNASPYVIGRLPAGEKWKSKATHCKSFDPNVTTSSTGASSSSVAGRQPGRAGLSESAARAAVLAWLWDWANARGVSK